LERREKNEQNKIKADSKEMCCLLFCAGNGTRSFLAPKALSFSKKPRHARGFCAPQNAARRAEEG
jgi:hypothetical protein